MRPATIALAAIALVACQPPAAPGASSSGTSIPFPMESRDYVYRDSQANSADDLPHELGLRIRQVRVSRSEGEQVVECRVTDTDQYPFPDARSRTVLWVRDGDRIVVKTASGDATLDGWPASWTAPLGLATPAPPDSLELRPAQVSALATTSAVTRVSQVSGLSYATPLQSVFRDCLLVRQFFTTDSAEFKPLSAGAVNLTERTLAPKVGILFESTLAETLIGDNRSVTRTYTRIVSELATFSAVASP